MAVTIIRATSTAETRRDRNHNGGDHQTAEDNAYNGWGAESATIAIAIRVTAFSRTALRIENAVSARFSTDAIRTTLLVRIAIVINRAVCTSRGTC